MVSILRFNVTKQAGNKIDWIADTNVSVTLCPRATVIAEIPVPSGIEKR